MKHILSLVLIGLLLSCSSSNNEEKKDEQKNYIEGHPIDFVNPFIGTGGHGHTYPGATMPFGMVQLSPDTRLDGWDGCGGYHYSDSIIFGFSHTHLSGTGVSDYGDILVTPFNSEDIPAYQELMNHSKTKSKFEKVSEEAHPGYYAVHLDDFDIDVKLTSTTRVGIHSYIFNNPKNRKIALNLYHRDKVLDCKFEIVNDRTIVGFRTSDAWATEQHIYFVMEFSEPFKADFPSGQATVKDLFRVLSFEDGEQELIVKVAISAVDIEGAKKNMKAEAQSFDFKDYASAARETWEKQISKIEVKGTNEEHMINFYTALYHTMIVPNIYNDVDGRYRGMDQKIHEGDGHDMYTVFSLWDTFRGAHPLYTIIERKRTKDFIETFLKQYQQGGALPVWELACNETGCMIGYHAVPVILEAARKGIQFDRQLALEAMIHSADQDHLGLKAYKMKNYIAAGDEAESVSKTLEYAYDDWCIAQFARLASKEVKGNPEIYDRFIKRAQNYQNLFNPETGFMQAKMNGGFAPNFDPSEVNFNYTEANSWQYSMFVPHDISGLIGLHGGADQFEKKLDLLFTTEMELSGRHQVDITGLIGQYAHGNEPSHHMAYLYNYIGKPWKTQQRIRQILTEQYWNGPDGLSGNEDCGQMSAWYVMSAMGFYSVTPGSNEYALGAPLFDEVKINLENGKHFIIKANNNSEENMYIQSVKSKNGNHNRSFITFDDFHYGNEYTFEMGSEPNKNWASKHNETPHSSIFVDDRTLPVPYIVASSQTFEDSIEVELKSICKDCKIKYTIPDRGAFEYTEPIKIKNTTFIFFHTERKGKTSKSVISKFTKIEGGKTAIYESEYSNQYSAGGDNALVDYLKGSPNFRTGYWQGFQGQNVVVIIDQGEIKKFKKVSVGVLQDIKSWIFYPKNMKISVGNNLKSSFKESGTIENKFPNNEYGAFTQELVKTFNSPVSARYIKIELEYPGDCPPWHLGNSGKAWVFVDEISID